MRIHRIRGRDLREALEKAGRMHGPQALVLGHENVSGGVTVAVADARRSQVVARPRAERAAEVRRAPGLDDVDRVLRRSGTSEALIADVLGEVAKGARHGAYALDEAAGLLGGRVPIAPSPKVAGRGPCAIAFCGPAGSGKTTTTAKLAARLAQKQRRAALVTFDAKARKRLADYAQLLQAPVDTARNAEDLLRLIERSRSFDAVLIDATGDSARDVALLRELRVRDPELRLEAYLLASATERRATLEEASAVHRHLPPSGLVVTHLDATREPAPVLEHSMASRIPVAFLCDGPEIGGHLRRPRPDDFADLFLRGEALVSRAARWTTPFVLLTGGKGGVGKTAATANLGVHLARQGKRVLLVDLDLGLANLNVMLRLAPRRNVEDALAGRCRLADCIVTGPGGVHVLPAGSGSAEMARLDDERRTQLLADLGELARGYELVIGDSAAGIGPDVLAFAARADVVIVVTTTDPTALTDAYGVVKALDAQAGETGVEIPTPEVFVNLVSGVDEAEAAAAKLRAVCERFLARSPRMAGWLPRTPAVRTACLEQRAFIAERWRNSLENHCLRRLAGRIERLLGERPAVICA